MKHTLLFLLLLLNLPACRQAQEIHSGDMGHGPATTAEVSVTNAPRVGEPIDTLNGITIYYNGSVHHTDGRHKHADGYNYGLKWQCVEFVKRYYYDYLLHAMPNPWGHAREFFNLYLSNGVKNAERGLYQFRNGSERKPLVDDIIVFGGDRYGHIAIVSKVAEDYIEVAQQNVGPHSRELFKLTNKEGRWYVRHSRALGWLSRFE